MKSLIFTSILFSLFSTQASAFCKINQYGHNICTGEKALRVMVDQDNKDINTKVNEEFKVVHVKSIIPRDSLAIIAGTKKGIPLDQLMGNKLCDSSEPLCEGQSVKIKSDCPNIQEKKEYKISKVYETQREDVVEVSTGMFFWKKTFLTDAECVDLI
jgi:hypothetical protein